MRPIEPTDSLRPRGVGAAGRVVQLTVLRDCQEDQVLAALCAEMSTMLDEQKFIAILARPGQVIG